MKFSFFNLLSQFSVQNLNPLKAQAWEKTVRVKSNMVSP